jgi:endonuclease YncB( thermonuclease family)
MRLRALVIALLLVLAACSDDEGPSQMPATATPAAPTRAPEATRIAVQMARAVDGDSLDAFVPQRVAVAYIGIEAPAGNTDCGRQATARHQQLIAGGVSLQAEAPFTFDSQGLRLYHAFTASGDSVALILIREGLARATEAPHRLRAQYQAAEAEARGARRGCVWLSDGG